MMIERFTVDHFRGMRVQERQAHTVPLAGPEFLSGLTKGACYSLLDGDTVLACAGLVPEGDYWVAWAWLSEDAGRHMVTLHRAVRTALEAVRSPVFAYAEDAFPEAGRWLAMLGFRPIEGCAMPGYTLYRRDHG